MKTLYKSIPENKISKSHKWQLNKWYKITEPLEICRTGFHASKNIIDAMDFVPMFWVAKVEVRGNSIIQEDKECWSEMRIVEWKKWTKEDSVSLSIFAAELVLDNFEKKYPNDKRPREAIEAAKAVLKNDNEKTRSAAELAESAAGSAAWSSAKSEAWSAAKSAGSAAWSAAWSSSAAAELAELAESAAKSAAWSAKSAAGSAEYQKIMTQCHDFVISRKRLK